jgi:hypothetical protein
LRIARSLSILATPGLARYDPNQAKSLIDHCGRRDQLTHSDRHAGEDQLPRCQTDLLLLAIVVGELLVDVCQLFSEVQLLLVDLDFGHLLVPLAGLGLEVGDVFGHCW